LVVSFNNLHALPRSAFRRRLTGLSAARMARTRRPLRAAVAR
jgi:hypothetical protein